MSYGPNNTSGIFLPTTINFPKDPDEFYIKINKMYVDIATRLNVKEVGIFYKVETLTGQQWFSNVTPTTGNSLIYRQPFRQVYELPATGAGSTASIAHGITGVGSTTTFTHIYGTAVTSAPDNRPIPYASATSVTEQIQIRVDSANILVTNGATAPGITSGYIVLEYLKN